MARVLGEEAQSGGLKCHALALNDSVPVSIPGLTVSTAAGSRMRFVMQTYRAALTHSHFIYDFAGMARAHCLLPLLRKPFMTWIHGIEAWEGARADRIRWARRAGILISNTAYTLERAERSHGRFTQARVCWLATEQDEPPKLARITEQPTVLIVGRIDEMGYKGHDALIDCWPHVVAAVPDAKLIIAGTGASLPIIQRKAALSSAAAKIEFKGFVPEAELDGLFSRATVFAMPSRGEGFGLVYIEAMRQGIPVVASIHDAAPEINLDGLTGYNVNLDKPSELPDRLIQLLGNPTLASDLGANGRRRWLEHFRYSAFRSRFIPIMREFLQ